MKSLPLDIELFHLLNAHDCSLHWWAQLNLFVTDNSMYIWFLLAFLLVFTRGKAGFYPLFLSVAGFFVAWHLSDEILKPLFNRPRPFVELSDLCVLSQHLPESRSFPSGHMITSAAIATLLYLYHRRWWVGILGGVFALFVGYTRIYIGVHFPSDILAGAVFGSLVASAWYYATEWARKHYQQGTG